MPLSPMYILGNLSRCFITVVRWNLCNNCIMSFCLLPGGITLHWTVDENEVTCIIKFNMMFNCAKNCANWYGYFKDMGIWMQWSGLILQMKSWVVDFITRYYKFVQYRVNRCFQNKTMLKCTKNYANRFCRFKDIDSQRYWPTFLAHPVYTITI